MDCGLSGSSVQGILQERILEWMPFPSPGYLSNPGIEPMVLMCPTLDTGMLYHWNATSPQFSSRTNLSSLLGLSVLDFTRRRQFSHLVCLEDPDCLCVTCVFNL